MKKLLLSILLTILQIIASAETVEIDGIWYNIDSQTNTAEVTQNLSGNKYSGDIVIPETITYNEISYSVKTIGLSAFMECSELLSILMPNSVYSIDSKAFYYCKGLKSITFSNNLTSIYPYAFSGCESLKSVTLPSSLRGIGDEAFGFCYNLKDVYCYANDPPEIIRRGTVLDGPFDYTRTKATLHVPLLSLEKYRNDKFWSGFLYYEAIPESDPFINPVDGIGGHEYVDLGLPSGRLWAKTNYGAYSEGDDGEYINWNDRDVVSQNWGNDWGVPTYEDILELCNNCSYYWTYNSKDILGCYFTGKNGNSIFLPASGYWIINYIGGKGILSYWTDTKSATQNYAHCLGGSRNDGVNPNDEYDYTKYILPIRPVVKSKTAYDIKPNPTPVDPTPVDPAPVDPDSSEPQPYAVLSNNNTILTFYYDKKKISRNGMSVGPIAYDEINYKPLSEWDKFRSSIKTVVFDDSFADCYEITSTAYWFYSFNNLEEIKGIRNLNTENVTDMSYMFIWCGNLMALDLSNFNTINVSDMSHMFQQCSKLKELNFINFDTKNVINMCQMFYDCSSISSLDLSKFNTGNVKDMKFMFYQCTNLETLDLSNFNTEKVTDMDMIFYNCSNLRKIYVLNDWETGNIPEKSFIFYGCFSLEGGEGTKWRDGEIWPSYARIDRGSQVPGYFTKKETISINREYVDLELPSGNLWAKTNVGAENEYDYGYYYAFGEIYPKDYYYLENYKWYDQVSNQYTKYSAEFSIAKPWLLAEDDVATHKWGNIWRTPNQSDFTELINNCTSNWEVLNGVKGRRFTGSNGNSVFFPASGFIYFDNEYRDELGYYMTSNTDVYNKVCLFYFSESDVSDYWVNVMYQGYSVRPITNKENAKVKSAFVDNNEIKEIYDLRGLRKKDLSKGINILKTKNGKTIKRIVK